MKHHRGSLGLATLVVVGLCLWLGSAGTARASSFESGPPPQQANVSAEASSVLAGDFTSTQATRGQQSFQQACRACHDVAEHTGRRFATKWAGTTVGELFDLISTTMPDGDPGSLKPDEYASIIAFFLRESGYPEGKDELPVDVAALMKLRINPPPK